MVSTKIVIKPIALMVALSFAGEAYAIGNGTIVSGDGGIIKIPDGTIVEQHSDKLIVDWDNMNISKNEQLNFRQPGENSAVLNRINSLDPTLIQGILNANGKVFIVNPNGVLISNGAAVNVGSLVASSLNIKNDDFNNESYHFKGGNNGKVINQGKITSNNSTVLIAENEVANQGSITSQHDDVHLASGGDITLSFPAMKKVNIKINQGSLNALINNGGLIVAKNGSIVLTAWATDKLTRGVINHSGMMEASGIHYDSDGSIYLNSKGNGIVNVSGNLSANNVAGHIDVSGAAINVDSRASLKTDTAVNLTTMADNSYVNFGTSSINADRINIVSDNVLSGEYGSVVTFYGDVNIDTRSRSNNMDIANNTVVNESGIETGKNIINNKFVSAVAKSNKKLRISTGDGDVDINGMQQYYGNVSLESKGNVNINGSLFGDSLTVKSHSVKQLTGAQITMQSLVDFNANEILQQGNITSEHDIHLISTGGFNQNDGARTSAKNLVKYSGKQIHLDGKTTTNNLDVVAGEKMVQGGSSSFDAAHMSLLQGGFDLSAGTNRIGSVFVDGDALNLSATSAVDILSGSKLRHNLKINSINDVKISDVMVSGDVDITTKTNFKLGGMLNSNGHIAISANDIYEVIDFDSRNDPVISAGKGMTLIAKKNIILDKLYSQNQWGWANGNIDLSAKDIHVKNIRTFGDVNAVADNSVDINRIDSGKATVSAGGKVNVDTIRVSGDLTINSGQDTWFRQLDAIDNIAISAGSIHAQKKNDDSLGEINAGKNLTLTAKNGIYVGDIIGGSERWGQSDVNVSAGSIYANSVYSSGNAYIKTSKSPSSTGDMYILSVVAENNAEVNSSGNIQFDYFSVGNNLNVSSEKNVFFEGYMHASGNVVVSAENIKGVNDIHHNDGFNIRSGKNTSLTARNNMDVGSIFAESRDNSGINLNGKNINVSTLLTGESVDITSTGNVMLGSGGTSAGKDFNASVLGDFTFSSDIKAYNNILIRANNITSQTSWSSWQPQPVIKSHGNTTLMANNMINVATIRAGEWSNYHMGSMSLNAGKIKAGQIDATGNVTLTTVKSGLNSGDITLGSLYARNGIISAGGDVRLDYSQLIYNMNVNAAKDVAMREIFNTGGNTEIIGNNISIDKASSANEVNIKASGNVNYAGTGYANTNISTTGGDVYLNGYGSAGDLFIDASGMVKINNSLNVRKNLHVISKGKGIFFGDYINVHVDGNAELTTPGDIIQEHFGYPGISIGKNLTYTVSQSSHIGDGYGGPLFADVGGHINTIIK